MKKKTALDRNICVSTVRGKIKYIVNITLPNKKRKKVYLNTKAEARLWLEKYKKSLGLDLSDFALLNPNQLADIRLALSILPTGESLVECVKTSINYNSNKATKNLEGSVEEFLANKKDLVSEHYYKDIKNMTRRFKEKFLDWEAVKPDLFMQWIHSISEKTKTQRHYFNTIKELYDFAVKKAYCKDDIFSKIHKSEVPKVVRSEIAILTVENTIEYFNRIQKFFPEYTGVLALVAFGGFRLAEAQRLTEKSINWDMKEILLPFKDSKTGQTWLQSKMPDNVWAWLEKYPPNPKWKTKLPENIVEQKKGLGFDRNSLRHAFATYHLSLYRDAPTTSILLRHTNPQQLWQTYLAGLTSDITAQAYFNIKPSSKTDTSENILS